MGVARVLQITVHRVALASFSQGRLLLCLLPLELEAPPYQVPSPHRVGP